MPLTFDAYAICGSFIAALFVICFTVEMRARAYHRIASACEFSILACVSTALFIAIISTL